MINSAFEAYRKGQQDYKAGKAYEIPDYDDNELILAYSDGFLDAEDEDLGCSGCKGECAA